MAILNSPQLTEIRVEVSAEIPVNYQKSLANNAIQAIEDWFTSAPVQASLSSAIDAATTPTILSNAQKRSFVKFWLKQRFNRGN